MATMNQSMRIRIPQVEGTIDLANPPEDLEKIIREAFGRYTEGTATDYQYEDKLMFLDVFRRNIYEWAYGQDDEEAVEEVVTENYRYELHESGKPPRDEDLYTTALLAQIYDHGFRPFRFKDESIPERKAETVRKSILRIIITVVNCEAE